MPGGVGLSLGPWRGAPSWACCPLTLCWPRPCSAPRGRADPAGWLSHAVGRQVCGRSQLMGDAGRGGTGRERPGRSSPCALVAFLTLAATPPGFQSSVSRFASSSRLPVTQDPGPYNPAASFVPSAQAASYFLWSLRSGLSHFSCLASWPP